LSVPPPHNLVRFYSFSDLYRLGLEPEISSAVRVRLWRPGDLLPGPEAFLGHTHIVYSAFHRLGVFANADYSAICIEEEDGTLLHVSCIFPRFFRFPFMATNDLQIGATYTVLGARGRGLAKRALIEAVRQLSSPGRAFWYLAEVANQASCRVAEQAGFKVVGHGERIARLGLSVLGAYRILQE